MNKRFLIPLLISLHLFANDPEGHKVSFQKVSMYELVKFVSRIAEVNFIGDQTLLDFEVSFISGKASTSDELLDMLLHMLEQNGLEVVDKKGCFLIRRAALEEQTIGVSDSALKSIKGHKEGRFNVYKLQYHQGGEILDAIKQISHDLLATGSGDQELLSTISSMQWIKSTNSLFFSGPDNAIQKLCGLIETLDIPLKQVFIEVLVIETNINNSLDFGLKWSASSKYNNSLGGSFGNMPALSDGTGLSADFPKNIPSSGRGFDLGIIGDVIFHKGQSFLSLGALVSALQRDGDSSIVLNQKIITQENKNSEIFVGSNIPFAGSIVQTIGTGQQTTANIEYKDVGVLLSITPLLGESDMITLDINEQITEALDHPMHNNHQLSGIQTSKTQMTTSVHVPDGHFVILSGMTRSVETKQKSGLPCLGGLPLIGSLFSHKENKQDKTNLLIFVKPHIIHSPEEYQIFSQELKTPEETPA